MTRWLCFAFVVLAACGDDGGGTTIDAPPDPCAPNMQFTGEYVDWDSTEAAFHGIMSAQFVLRSDTTKMASTAPNGRFIMCIPPEDGSVDITPPTGSNYVGGTVVVNKQVIQTGAMLSYRSFTMTRGADFGFDASKAGVFVHVEGNRRAVSLGKAGTAWAYDGTTWAQGATGVDVYFAGVDPASGSTTVSMSNSTGAGTVPLTAGAITYLTIIGK